MQNKGHMAKMSRFSSCTADSPRSSSGYCTAITAGYGFFRILAPFLRNNAQLMKRRLFVVFALILSTGCILSPDIEQEPEELLYAPEIMLDHLNPPDDSIIKLEEACASRKVTFQVGQIRDFNVRDTLYIRWIINWDPTENRLDELGWEGYLINPTTTQIRPGASKILDYDNTQFDSSLYAINTLKFIVADRPLRSGGNGLEFPPDSDGAGQLASYQWTLEVAESGYCNVD